jgi:hypothetical protein
MRRSGWLTFSAVVLIIAGTMRVIDAIWAFGYHGAIPDNLQGALLGHSLATYGWIWLIIGIVLIVAGALVLGPSDQRSAEVSRWIGIVAAALARHLGHLRDAVLPGLGPHLHRHRSHGDLRPVGPLWRAGSLTRSPGRVTPCVWPFAQVPHPSSRSAGKSTSCPLRICAKSCCI